MKLGLGSYAAAWEIGAPGFPSPSPLTAEGLVERASELGLGIVQIADNLPIERLSQSELDALRRRAVELGVGIELGTRGIGAEHLRTFQELCQFFGSPLLRVVVDTASHHPSPAEVVDLIRKALPDFAAAGVLLAIENHDRFSCATLASILQEIGSARVGVCLDTVNSFGSLEGPDVVVRTLAPFVVNLHVKDFKIKRAKHMMGFIIEGTPAGEGQLDLAWLLDVLRTAGRDPNAILELWPPPETDILATIQKERRWAEVSVRNLRPLIPN